MVQLNPNRRAADVLRSGHRPGPIGRPDTANVRRHRRRDPHRPPQSKGLLISFAAWGGADDPDPAVALCDLARRRPDGSTDARRSRRASIASEWFEVPHV